MFSFNSKSFVYQKGASKIEFLSFNWPDTGTIWILGKILYWDKRRFSSLDWDLMKAERYLKTRLLKPTRMNDISVMFGYWKKNAC